MGDIANKKTPECIAAEIVAFNQEKIASNDRCNTMLARRAKVTMVLLCAAP